MEIASTPPTTPIAPATGTTADSSLSQLSEDYTQFLTLLTAQISNQDPLAPMDSTQFVSQLAQLSQVEQAVQTNDNLDALSGQIATLTVVSGPNMVGRSVTVPSSQIDVTGQVADPFYYQLSSGASSVTAEIRDPTGFLVRSITGLPTDPGEDFPIAWDGLDNSGQPVLDGSYTVSMVATDNQGNAVPVYTSRDTTVEEVSFSADQVFYTVGGDEVVLADAVISVR